MSTERPTVLQLIHEQTARVLETYRIDPGLIQEHANAERNIKEGGYGDRQIYELVQNGADELRNDRGGEIAVVLTDTHLYCANQGTAITPEGVDTILRMGVSRKRGGQIGRFGVGVKSYLSVTDTPEFFSREDDKSFGFDKEWAAQEIRRVQPAAKDTPVLRMARPLDRDREAAADPVLKELLSWATTVVRLPLKPSAVERLARDIEYFPAEFALFSPHVGTVTLEDRRVSRKKKATWQIFQHVDGDRHRLQKVKVEGEEEQSHSEAWRVFTDIYRPSREALEDAGELHDRPEIDIAWAVPEDPERARERGEFWAYFPTNYTLTLRGIVNAPWKTGTDRQNLYAGNRYNTELITEVAELVVHSFPRLAREGDPAAYLEYAPARGREEPQWAARDLVAKIWETAARSRVFPDQNGHFGTPREVRVHPENLRPEWLDLWAGYPGRPTNWIHHSVDKSKRRRDSVNRILEHAKISAADAQEWLEALVSDGSPEASARAILIAAGMKETGHKEADNALRARIVLTESEGMVAPSNRIFRRSTDDGLADTTIYVDERVYTGNPTVIRALDVLGIREADPAGRLASVVERGFHGYGDRDWTAFWELVRLAGPAGVRAAFHGRDDTDKVVRVRTMAGDFRPIKDCLLPGRVVPRDGSRDKHVAVDMDFHRDDRTALLELGLLEVPKTDVDPEGESWFEAYKEAYWKLYVARLPASESRPTLAKMHFSGSRPAGPLHFLELLSPEGRAAFLQNIPSGGAVLNWTMQPGNKGAASRLTIPSPIRWMARRHGYLQTSRGLRKVTECVGPGLRMYRDILPVAEVSDSIATMLRLPLRLDELTDGHWKEIVAEASASTDDTFPGRVYALLFDAGAAFPEEETTRCRVGDEWRSDVDDSEIVVTANRKEYEALIRERIPALLVPSDDLAERMREEWGMLAPSDVIQKEIQRIEPSDPVPLLEEFPHLKMVRRSQVEGWSTVRCGDLQEIIRTPNGMRTETIPMAVLPQERQILVRMPVDDLQVLQTVDRALKLNLGPAGCKGILERREQQRSNERLQRVRQAKDLPEKLRLLVGEESLRKALPTGLLEREEAEKGPVDARRIAELAHNAYRTTVLQVYRKDIEAATGISASFNGDAHSLRIVSDLGFSESYAGTRPQVLPAVEKVNGPTAFPRLHDYQEKLAQRAFDLLTKYEAPRAMLCLPTGAGKTRVTAEAVIRVIKERGLGGKPVLWIAQSEELCEQAVQSWAFVWSKVGPEEQLVINRLWANREAAPSSDTPQLVVATDAKLEVCLGKPEYAWLRDPAIVIVDEAHTSITSRYTEILALLGLTRHRTSRPLLGLTATPFRGFNEAETRRLVERYGGVRLDEGIFETDDPYSELQELGVLARVDHRELKGSTLELSPEDLQRTAFDGARLPASVEERLGQDTERNNTLLKEIEALPRDSQILLFATSVNHARLMAALLNDRGIPAEAIDSTTQAAHRRSVIENFRAKKIRVLTNYNVLAQGFDAPATDVVIVARPTYSPNVYQQMIGRGLRGPRNGGKEVCLILDVADNIVNFDRQLAFTQFEYLWRKQ